MRPPGLACCEFESHSGEVYSMLHYVIKFFRDMRQIDDFFWVFLLPLPIKLTATIYKGVVNYCMNYCSFNSINKMANLIFQ